MTREESAKVAADIEKQQAGYKKRADRLTKQFMKSAKEFLATKLTGSPSGKIPDEFELNLILLESYYKTFIMLNLQINDLDSVVIMGKYGWQAHPLLQIRDRACVRLESLMKQLGLTLKAGRLIGTTEVKKEETALDAFLRQKTNK